MEYIVTNHAIARFKERFNAEYKALIAAYGQSPSDTQIAAHLKSLLNGSRTDKSFHNNTAKMVQLREKYGFKRDFAFKLNLDKKVVFCMDGAVVLTVFKFENNRYTVHKKFIEHSKGGKSFELQELPKAMLSKMELTPKGTLAGDNHQVLVNGKIQTLMSLETAISYCETHSLSNQKNKLMAAMNQFKLKALPQSAFPLQVKAISNICIIMTNISLVSDDSCVFLTVPLLEDILIPIEIPNDTAIAAIQKEEALRLNFIRENEAKKERIIQERKERGPVILKKAQENAKDILAKYQLTPFELGGDIGYSLINKITLKEGKLLEKTEAYRLFETDLNGKTVYFLRDNLERFWLSFHKMAQD